MSQISDSVLCICSFPQTVQTDWFNRMTQISNLTYQREKRWLLRWVLHHSLLLENIWKCVWFLFGFDFWMQRDMHTVHQIKHQNKQSAIWGKIGMLIMFYSQSFSILHQFCSTCEQVLQHSDGLFSVCMSWMHRCLLKTTREKYTDFQISCEHGMWIAHSNSNHALAVSSFA